MSAPGGGEAGVFGDVVGDDGGGDFVHFEAAVGFGNFGRAEAEFAGFLQQVAGDGEVLVLDLLDVGKDLVDGKLLRRLADELVLLGEVFGSEDFVGAAFFEQKAAAGDSGLCAAVVAMRPLLYKATKVTQRKAWTCAFVVDCFSLPPWTVHKSSDAVFQMHNIEVYKQPEGFATELKVRK